MNDQRSIAREASLSAIWFQANQDVTTVSTDDILELWYALDGLINHTERQGLGFILTDHVYSIYNRCDFTLQSRGLILNNPEGTRYWSNDNR